MKTFDAAIERATTPGETINALTFVWFQGKADVYPDDYALYEARSRKLIQAVETHAKDNWTSGDGHYPLCGRRGFR